MLLKSTRKFAVKYYFDQDVSNEDPRMIDMLISMLTTHGAGGKFAEHIIREKFKISENSGIHDWDGEIPNFMVEMKMETISTTKMNAMGTYGDNRKSTKVRKGELFQEVRPLVIHFGTCIETGKCIYAMVVDTRFLPKQSKLFNELDKDAPRVSFHHFKEHPESYKLLFRNDNLLEKWQFKFNRSFYQELVQMNPEKRTTLEKIIEKTA